MTESILEMRKIEALFAKGVFDVLAERLGREEALAILNQVVRRMAVEAGVKFRGKTESGTTDLLAFADLLRFWTMNDALSIEFLHKSADRLDFNVTRCRYAEFYREVGVAELGPYLSCNRDEAFCEGFDSSTRLTRTQTIMEGAEYCDFRYVREKNE